MFKNWLKSRPRGLALPRIVWDSCVLRLPFVATLSTEMRDRLIALADEFVASKDFTGAHGFEITDHVKASIALQACLPVLRFGLAPYRDFVEIIVYPDRFLTPQSRVDEAGVVHESIEELSGETMPGGPVVLAWPDAQPSSDTPGMSVVIHEFVHKLDMLDGEADGVPPLPSGMRRRWVATLEQAYDDFCEMLDDVERSIPIDIDPESGAADPFYSQLPMDAYAATDLAEFFAVASETYFTHPEPIRTHFPQLFALLAEYFGPAGDQASGLTRA